jgi:hypothetical protein
MSLKDSVKNAARSAGIAAATAGLSTCQSSCGTVVDPAPPPLVCSDVANGQSLVPTATKSGDDIAVSIRVAGNVSRWQITRVGDPVGATIGGTTLPATPNDPLVVTLRPTAASTSQIDFTVEGVLTGYQNQTCNIKRTFHVSISGTGVQVAETKLDTLPLSARHGVQIAVVHRAERTLSLEARTTYAGPLRVAWEVTGGELDALGSPRVRWTLPAEPGIYQAEVLLDYGADGVAFDTLMLEVTDGHPEQGEGSRQSG